MNGITKVLLAATIFAFFQGVTWADSAIVENPYNGHVYQRFDASMTWHTANEFCESQGGYLATLTSKQESDFVWDNLARFVDRFTWLGATYYGHEGTWTWTTGEPWSFSYWGGGEPNNCRGIEHYLVFFRSGVSRASYWNDLGEGRSGGCGCGGCYREYYQVSTICEWDTKVIDAEIDIKPGSDPNSINLNNNGVIPVAFLTTDDFDAADVNADTVKFGEGEASPVHSGHLEDVDDDGDIDLVLHFNTQDAGISSADTEATLTGETTDGQKIEGSDSVRPLDKGGKKNE